MDRKVYLQHNTANDLYEVTLIENNQVVFTKSYHDYKLAEQARTSWMSGEGPEFLAG
jgi:hypothetical protein